MGHFESKTYPKYVEWQPTYSIASHNYHQHFNHLKKNIVKLNYEAGPDDRDGSGQNPTRDLTRPDCVLPNPTQAIMHKGKKVLKA